jgi:hypothetical protein
LRVVTSRDPPTTREGGDPSGTALLPLLRSAVGSSPADGETRRTRVLVVEDAPEFVAMLVGLLEREGYHVDTEVCRRIRTFSDAARRCR